MSYNKEVTEQILGRYNWLKGKGDFEKRDKDGERTPEYHNLTHLENELNMCERILVDKLGEEKFNELRTFVNESYKRLDVVFGG